ncbi:MAG TPA: hypothetical protein DCY26_07425 [Hyphomonas sp.]|nr:hypothetical protein [Hyphomonas sp.]
MITGRVDVEVITNLYTVASFFWILNRTTSLFIDISIAFEKRLHFPLEISWTDRTVVGFSRPNGINAKINVELFAFR